MARPKFNFEKDKKEKARRRKQIEKSAKRMMTKKGKMASVPARETDALADNKEATTE